MWLVVEQDLVWQSSSGAQPRALEVGCEFEMGAQAAEEPEDGRVLQMMCVVLGIALCE